MTHRDAGGSPVASGPVPPRSGMLQLMVPPAAPTVTPRGVQTHAGRQRGRPLPRRSASRSRRAACRSAPRSRRPRRRCSSPQRVGHDVADVRPDRVVGLVDQQVVGRGGDAVGSAAVLLAAPPAISGVSVAMTTVLLIEPEPPPATLSATSGANRHRDRLLGAAVDLRPGAGERVVARPASWIRPPGTCSCRTGARPRPRGTPVRPAACRLTRTLKASLALVAAGLRAVMT